MRTSEKGVTDALRVINSHDDGISASEVAKLIGLGIDSTLEKLRVLRRRGQAGCSRAGGVQALWMSPDKAAAARLAYAEEQRLKAAAAHAARHRKAVDAAIAAAAAAAAKLEEDADADLADSWAPIRRIVPAHLAAPIQCSAPRWVFEAAGRG